MPMVWALGRLESFCCETQFQGYRFGCYVFALRHRSSFWESETLKKDVER